MTSVLNFRLCYYDFKDFVWNACVFFFFFKQKTAYEVVSRDWSSDVCSSDLAYKVLTEYFCEFQPKMTFWEFFQYVSSQLWGMSERV